MECKARNGRVGCFLPYEQNRVYPPELKMNAVQEYLSGAGTLEEIGKNISCETIVNSATG
jgi:transposase-like protein